MVWFLVSWLLATASLCVSFAAKDYSERKYFGGGIQVFLALVNVFHAASIILKHT